MQQITRTLENKTYYWSGRTWLDQRTHGVPPMIVVLRLNRLAEAALRTEDAKITDTAALLKLARQSRDAGNLGRSEALARQVLSTHPRHGGAMASLCATLRARKQPTLALSETTNGYSTRELHTSRAAAWCDLERWHEAVAELDRAFSYGYSIEAASVAARINAARPGLV